MTRVLLFSHTTGYQLRAFNDAAEALGIELVFATDRCHKLDDPWQDRAIPVRFHELDASVEAIVERASRDPVDGVIAVGDRAIVLAARAAAALNLPWHSVDGALASTDKRRSRAALAAAGLPSPRFRIVDARSGIGDQGSGIGGEGFPCVLKPVGLSGSRGVIRANAPGEFVAAFNRIRLLLARPEVRATRAGQEDQILVEDYVAGDEFAVEGVMTRGALTVFALFDKPDPLEGPFFEETIYVTPSRLGTAAQAAIADQIRRACEALGLWHGPVHAECRVTADGVVYVLEVAARPIGGLCSRVLTFHGPASPKRELHTAREGGPAPPKRDPDTAREGGPASPKRELHTAREGGPASPKRDPDTAREGGPAPPKRDPDTAREGGPAPPKRDRDTAREGGSLETVLLRHAVGASIDGWSRDDAAAAVMMIPIPARGMYKGVEGERDARAVPGVTDIRITAKPGQLLETLPEAGSYLGFIFATGNSPAEAEAAVRTAHPKLSFAISRELTVNSEPVTAVSEL